MAPQPHRRVAHVVAVCDSWRLWLQLAALRDAAGAAGPDDARLLAMMDEEDFDPATYDARMASAFGGDYYDVSCCGG